MRDRAPRDSKGRAGRSTRPRSARFSAVSLAIAGAVALAGCTFLVQFHDEPGADLDADIDATDEAAGDFDAGFEASDFDQETPDEGPIDADFVCPADANGLEWRAGDDTARCCGGKAVATTTEQNCGACGIRCNVDAGQTCAKVVDHYYCLGCNVPEAGNDSCWSGCCSLSFYKQGACAASVCATGACNPAVCPKGTTCKTPPTSSNYCGYD